ncbi:MAG: outer membrane protein OmpA [Sphingobacteriaceae bacterium]|nr:outer membrane protein OmpA [Sphingobacteriaceae bacterium]
MSTINKILQRLAICLLVLVLSKSAANAQVAQSPWWFGISGAANLNFYDGFTQRMNNSLIVPTAFHKGIGVRPFGSVLMEYRPGRRWGAMLNAGYDSRGAKFRDVVAPCNCPATLTAETKYVTVEPSVRIGFEKSQFFFFAGPRVAFNLKNDFAYTQLKQPNTNSEFSATRKTIFSGQAGVGYDHIISSPSSTSKISLSPFLSFHPNIGQNPRSIETWSVATIRTGIALKFGKGPAVTEQDRPAIATVAERGIVFSVREPKAVAASRVMSETLPLRNSVFFNEGSTEIPNRYILLSQEDAARFREAGLEKEQTTNISGRSVRQLNVYHNILNIIGDRLRSNPGASISLSGASLTGAPDGRKMAEAVKSYLVSNFGIEGSRIATNGRVKPLNPSEQPGGTKELSLLREGDRRVDIASESPELLLEVGGGMMKPVSILATQTDPLDSHVIFNVDGGNEMLKSWNIDVTDERGAVQHYGPFTGDEQSISGKTILGNNPSGNYKIAMTGETKNGLTIRKESTIRLDRQKEAVQKGFRYSVLFDFNKANTIASYNKFLTTIVSPSISSGSTVIIHGHTDIIGEDGYNHSLSHDRALQTQKILENALSGSGKNNVKFETLGFGEDLSHSPFDNSLPEERFYNRTVIIDIVPANAR